MTIPLERPYIIDIEASGFGPEGYPIEIGIAMEQDRKFCSLLLPHKDWTHWDPGAEKKHRIPRDILELYGNQLHEVAVTLNALLKGRTIYSDAWVVDKNWLSKLYYNTALSQTFTLSSLEIILTEEQINIWDETKLEVIQSLGLQRHRASSDALIVQETYLRTRQRQSNG